MSSFINWIHLLKYPPSIWAVSPPASQPKPATKTHAIQAPPEDAMQESEYYFASAPANCHASSPNPSGQLASLPAPAKVAQETPNSFEDGMEPDWFNGDNSAFEALVSQAQRAQPDILQAAVEGMYTVADSLYQSGAAQQSSLGYLTISEDTE